MRPCPIGCRRRVPSAEGPSARTSGGWEASRITRSAPRPRTGRASGRLARGWPSFPLEKARIGWSGAFYPLASFRSMPAVIPTSFRRNDHASLPSARVVDHSHRHWRQSHGARATGLGGELAEIIMAFGRPTCGSRGGRGGGTGVPGLAEAQAARAAKIAVSPADDVSTIKG